MTPLLVAAALAAPPATPVPAPPVRAFADLPYVTPRAGFLQTEGEAVDLVRSLLADAVRDGREIRVVFAEHAQEPTYGGGTITLQRFVTRDAAWVRRELADAQPTTWAPLLAGTWTDDELVEAWHAAHVAALARLYATAIRDSWGRLDASHPGAEETLARTVEIAVLDALAAEGRVPAAWPALYRRFVHDAVANAPAAEVSALPAPGPERDRRFDEALAAAGEPLPVARDAAYLAFAASDAAAAARPAFDAALLARLGDYDERERDQIAATLASFAASVGLPEPVVKHDGTGPEVLAVAGDAGTVAVWSFGGTAVVRAAAPVALSKGQEKKAARVVNAWNHDLRGATVIVEHGAVIVTTGQLPWHDAGELRAAIDVAWEVLDVVAPALRTLGDGAAVDAVIAAPRPLFEAKELVTW